jgi:hypothetical protein
MNFRITGIMSYLIRNLYLLFHLLKKEQKSNNWNNLNYVIVFIELIWKQYYDGKIY